MYSVSNVKNVLISLIESIDMYNYLLRNHHSRTASIAYQLGLSYGLDKQRLSNLVLAASVHDIGALHIKERSQLLYIDAINPGPHEKLGAVMLSGFKPFNDICKIIRYHHINYSDIISGKVQKKEVPIECFFLHLADRIDVLLTTTPDVSNLQEYVISSINMRFGKVFSPDLKKTFTPLTSSQEFWDNIDSSYFHEILFKSISGNECKIDEDDLDALAGVFAMIVDLKTPWTTYHSKSVSQLAQNIAKLYGMDKDSCHKLKLAGLLHDIGKVAIPTEVIEKPDLLNSIDYKIYKSHATYTSLILSKIPIFNDVAKWASAHHEMRDSSGYPLHVSDDEFSIEMDILAYSNIFSSLSEARPYREALPKDEILHTLKEYSATKLSNSIYKVIENNMDELYDMNKKCTQVAMQS